MSEQHVNTVREITRTTRFADLPELLKVPEVVAFLGVNKDTVYNLIKRGLLAHVRVGDKLVFVPKTALLASAVADAATVPAESAPPRRAARRGFGHKMLERQIAKRVAERILGEAEARGLGEAAEVRS